MGKVYKITTPHIHDDHVKAFQRAMEKHNYYHGEIDGDCGPLTVQGFYRSKFWLGYANPDHTGGDLLYQYLTEKRKLTQQMQARRNARIAEKPKIPIRERALAEARRHIGEKERTGHNDISYSDWWGVHGPWCAMFASWCYIHAGSKVFHRGKDHGYAYVPYIVGDARAGRNSLALTKHPAAGDLVCYDWERNGVADHVELFEQWLDRSRGIFSTVGGNTSGDDSGSQSNGGMVAHRKLHPRNTTNVQAFVHVGG